MTMTAQAALPSPPDPAAYHDPHHPTYGFHTEEWHDMPCSPTALACFTEEERYRREANAHAYRQYGTPQNWLRYLTLGYYVYDDCSKFDALWMKYSADPIICHRMVWYNFLYHVDRHLDISTTLSAWATDVSQPYLQRHAPQFLDCNTLESTWADHIRGDHDVMAIESTQWTTVGSTKRNSRSKSPPASFPTSTDTATQSRNATNISGARNHQSSRADSIPHIEGTPVIARLSAVRPSPASVDQGMDTTDQTHQPTASSNHTTASETSSVGKQSALQPYLNVPTNDGTYRLTFRWNPKGDFKQYHENPTTWLTGVHTLMNALFHDSDGSFYRWESLDLTSSAVMSELSPGELREFLSPKITFLPSTAQIVFGARVCFAATFPGQWKNLDRTRQLLKDNQVSVQISNSTTTSGRIVTAGYILFKAARTTHRTRFLQSMRTKLPPETPYFDILQFQRTPMEQKIDHLVVQCGENHVSPLSKALSELLPGHNSSLYLPRLALAKLSPTQISTYFEMQDKYSKTLKSLALSPTLTNLDKPRKEFFADGTVLERSTRDWAATLFTDRGDVSARCEVVNGGYDQKAYLLVPEQHFLTAQEHLRQYRLRINPIERREARFRDSLPGLPSVIHIDVSTQQNLDFLANLSSADVWRNAPTSVRADTSIHAPHLVSPVAHLNPWHHEGRPNPKSSNGGMDRKHTSRLSSLGEARKSAEDYHSQQGGQDDQTSSTKSATQSMATPSLLSHTTTRRLNELEAMFRSQQTTLTETTQMGKQMDAALQQTIHTLQENSDKLVLTMERQQDTHVQLVELSTRVSRLTEVMDKMASQLDALTNLTISQRVHGSIHASDLDPTGASRRRPIGELSMAGQSVDGSPATSGLHPVSPPEGPPAPGGIVNPPTSDTLASPTKKKARPIPVDKPGCTLHTDLEEMSLGSDNNGNTESPGRPARLSLLFHPPESNQIIGGSLLDDSSDDFSTNNDVMPGLDTQYTSPSDPEGGASR